MRGIGVAVITSTSGSSPLPRSAALLDAEAMLLVDHRDAELRECDALGDERVRADDDVDLTRRESVGDARALLARSTGR